jgi:murein L,D-transpeptidase YcbB/YkuD
LLTRRGTEINPRLVDFTQYTPANFPFRIKQRPSDDNALGQVKFLFPNEHSVYMHDTPHRELFARGVRAFSNGCIRLEKPVELAEMLLTGQVPDPAGYYQDLVAAGKERAVKLERTVPVLITYRTVTFEPDGTARFREDVYGRDAAVFRALEQAGVALPAAQG